MADWIDWPGGTSGPPEIPGLRCDLRRRNGEVDDEENSYDWWSDWNWPEGSQGAHDIVAYRVNDD
jgi:hypothetical protein